ncbi:hypothetical protein VCHA53O466_140026 [Vibrio chagasii]|nr:hypothetical protein VCHA53O466_140026 [Vibrio chagasii]
MSVLCFNGDYKKLKGVGFQFHRHNGIKYEYAPKQFYHGIWIIKADGGIIIDYNLNAFELQSELLEFALKNREMIESMPDTLENNTLNSIEIMFEDGRFKNSTRHIGSKQYYVKNLKIWLWLNDNGNLKPTKSPLIN